MLSCGIELVLILVSMAIFWKWIERNNYSQKSNCNKKKNDDLNWKKKLYEDWHYNKKLKSKIEIEIKTKIC
jgi:hypothetical protein